MSEVRTYTCDVCGNVYKHDEVCEFSMSVRFPSIGTKSFNTYGSINVRHLCLTCLNKFDTDVAVLAAPEVTNVTLEVKLIELLTEFVGEIAQEVLEG